MTKTQAMQVFSERKVRSVWDDESEEWYFSVVDVVEVLTDSKDPKQYIKKLRKRDPELDSKWGTICTPLTLTALDGKKRKSNCATTEGIFRIIQSIPSPKAEPFKQWMADVAAQRIDQLQNPELSIDQAILDYKRLGYSDAWINQRIKSIEVRKELTDEWARTGVTGTQYATLTDIITHQWSGFTTREYKRYKGLKKENLRDNMTNLELALNILAEAATTEISKDIDPHSFQENTEIAKKGGLAAKAARDEIEKSIGRSIISPKRASDYLNPYNESLEQADGNSD